jgi:hypothetical protein
MFTAMDVSVARARQELPERNIYEIRTAVGTLEFGKALKQLKDDNEFDNYKRQVKAFLEEFVSSVRADREKDRRVKDVIDGAARAIEEEKIKHEREMNVTLRLIREYHDEVCSSSSFKVLEKTIINTCNALSKNDKRTMDFLATTDIFVPTNNNVVGYGTVVMIGNQAAEIAAMRPQVFRLKSGNIDDRANYKITSIRIPMGSSEGLNQLRYSNIMFFFHPPLDRSEDTAYELSFSCQHAAMFDDLIDGKNFDTYIYGARTVSVDRLQIVCLLPENMDIMLVNLPVDKQVEKVGELGAWCRRWVPGFQTRPEDIRKYNSVPGFRAIGWQCENLEVGDVTGFRAVRGA